MLVIREAQMAALSHATRERFAVRLARSLSETFPETFPMPAAPATTQFVERAIEVALRHGIATENAVTAFANLRAAYGEHFEWTPVAAQALALLRDTALPGPIKVAAIRDCLRSATGGRPVTVVGERGD